MSKISERINIGVCVGVVLLILLPACRAVGASDKESKLLELARKKFPSLTKNDKEMEKLKKLFHAVVNGQVADYSNESEENNDPNTAKDWDPNTRVISADYIAWLCTDPEASQMVTHKGIRVKGARIDGELDLEFARISFPLDFEKSAFPKGINLRRAEIRQLSLVGTHTGPIYGDSVNIKGSVFLRDGFKAVGEVRLLNATIGGNLDCDGSQFINEGAKALNADGANIGGNVFLINGFKAEGEVNLIGATIGGDLCCEKGMFINPTGCALLADGVNIGGAVFLCNGFKAEGEVRLVGATIGTNLECGGSQFINKGANALSADGANIEGSVFLSNGFKAEGEVRLLSATIGRNLSCNGAQFINKGAKVLNADGVNIEGHVFLRNGFKAEGEVRLVSATIGGTLDCEKGHFINKGANALNANGVNIRGSVFLREGFKAEGEVNLLGATIGGDLDCEKGEFINKGAKALNANGANIGGNVFLRNGFKVEGEVNLVTAIIGGQLDCEKGGFINPGGYALNADRLNVIKGNVFLDNGFKAEGEVRFIGATISGDLSCTGAQFINKGAKALNADGLKVEGNVFLRDGFKAQGTVDFIGATIDKYFIWTDVNSPEKATLDLRSATVGTLWDNQDSWPDEGRLFLHGLVYNEIYDRAPRDAESRIDWLRRQPSFSSQPYEQLAEVFRKGGQDEDAKRILITKNKDRARLTKLTTRSEKFWYRVLGPMIGYGYRPLNALWGVAVFVALGSLLFGIGYWCNLITPQNDSAYVKRSVSTVVSYTEERKLSDVYPRFNFLMYSFDVFVPLIDLYQAKYWLPNANRGLKLLNIKGFSLHTGGMLRLYLWVHITMGWALTMLLVAGLTGLVRT